MIKSYIIAEAGVNHNGNMEIAKRLIEEAAAVGADAVKFQLFDASKLVTRDAEKAKYQTEHQKNNNSTKQFDMLKKLELTKENIFLLNDYANKFEIDFLCSAFDNESIEILNQLDMKFQKIPSGEITNLPYLRKIAKSKAKILLSTGMSTYGDIESAMDILERNGASEIVILQCNTEYPTPMDDVNLNAMVSMKRAFNKKVGYSDHTEGIEIAGAAVALGAQVIEKHFTLDRSLDGPDHKASIEPSDFKKMVKAIRNIESALGDGVKKLTKSEKENLAVVRKSIVANQIIKKGEIFSENNLTVKRPGNGLSPMMWEKLIGTTASKDYLKDDVIEL